MPNWCSNVVTLSHKDKKKMAVLLTELDKSDVFEKIRKASA